jgi:hypothetical protein
MVIFLFLLDFEEGGFDFGVFGGNGKGFSEVS